MSVASIAKRTTFSEHRPQRGQRIGGGHVEDQLEHQRAERVVDGVPHQLRDIESVERRFIGPRVNMVRVQRRRRRDRFLVDLSPSVNRKYMGPIKMSVNATITSVSTIR